MIYLLQGENTCISISVITFSAGGEHIFLYICYNLFYARGEHITYFLQGEIRAHKVSSSKRGRMLELAFDDTFVKPSQWSSFAQAYSRVLHDQDFSKRVAMVVFCNI